MQGGGRRNPDQDVIEELAKKTQRPVEEVTTIYREQLAILEAGAKTSMYLRIFAGRMTRNMLTKAQ